VKELDGTASASVAAPIEACFALIEAVDRYPSWYPDVVREAEIVERADDGRPTRTRATLHASIGPIVKDFRLVLAVTAERFSTVKLSRVPHDSTDPERFDVVWRLQPGEQTQIRLTLNASLSVPRLVPVRGIGDSMAAGFVAAAATALTQPRDEVR
jgi:ribosome-associated toxin RatA of RatAB toxin-antitoxin module